MGVPGKIYDVLIVGAGAAGCATATSLPEGTQTLLIDRGMPGRGRCCGGLLAPDAQAALARLRLALPGHVRVHPEPRHVHVRDLDSGLRQTYRRSYSNIDRARFDAWMLDLAEKRVAFQGRTRFAGLEREPGGLAVHLLHRGRRQRVHARIVIGADGARSAVRRACFPDRPAPQTAIAIQARLRADRPPASHEILFSSRYTDFYAWAIPKADTVLVGSAFSETRGARARFEEILRIMRDLLGLRGGVVARSARRLTRPRAPGEMLAGDSSVLLAGEAAGLVSPSSGEGLSFAIESGAAAGKAVAQDSPLKAYKPVFRRLARRVARKLIKARVILSPSLRRLALRLPWCP